MKNGNKNKYELLGEPFGTASAKLKKAILFKLVQQCSLDVCYRCQKQITEINNFSIEHKIPWQSARNPIEMFYDLENIAFSHLKCNTLFRNNYGEQDSDLGETGEKYITLRKDKFYKKTYRVKIPKNGKLVELGSFSTLKEAIIARDSFLKKTVSDLD